MQSVCDVILFPLIAAFIVLYFASRALVLKDQSAVISKNFKAKIDPEGYTKTAGIYLAVYAGCMFIYCALLYFNSLVGFLFIVLATIVIIILWRNLNRKHKVDKAS